MAQEEQRGAEGAAALVGWGGARSMVRIGLRGGLRKVRMNLSCVCCWGEGSAKFKPRESDRKGCAKEPRREGRRGVCDGARDVVHRGAAGPYQFGLFCCNTLVTRTLHGS